MFKADKRTENAAYPPGVPIDLGDGLLLKAVREAQDAERLAAFNAFVHHDEAVGVLTRWLMNGKHPAARHSDFLFVEDTTKGEIVSSLALVPQTWTYDGIPLRVGQVESVGTHPAYRGRGLIRAQMEVIERMLSARGCELSCIAGIPYFYKQFGYEFAIPWGSCAHLRLDQVPALVEGRKEPVTIRRINVDTDLPKAMSLYDAHAAELCLVSVRDEALWRYEESLPPGIPEPPETYVVEDHSSIMGYFRVKKSMWGPQLEFTEASVRPAGQVWGSQNALLAILRFVRALAAQRKFCKLDFALPRTHPLVTVARYLGAELERQYAWQVRIVDHVDFLQRIAPALERRLAHSLLAGFSGPLGINTMTRLIRLQFNQGRLACITDEGYQQGQGEVRMPPLTLNQLLLGYRSCQEIMDCQLEVWGRPEARQLVDVLFPKVESFIYSTI